MNIAFLTEALPYVPSPGGFRLYGANLIRCLSRRHRIDLVSLIQTGDQDHIDWPARFCAKITTMQSRRWGLSSRVANLASSYLWGRPTHYRREVEAVLRAELRARRWDVLHVEGGYIAGLVPDLGIPTVLSAHDSWTLRCHEMLRCAQSLREKLYYRVLNVQEPRYARLVYPRFDCCVVVGERDRRAVQQLVPDVPCFTISNGVDTDYFIPIDVPREAPTLVFHGHLGFAPNIEAIAHFADTVLPIVRRRVPNALFHIVGAQPSPVIRDLARRSDVTLSADLPDLRLAVSSAHVYVAPIRFGTGVKNKLLEAMALGLPIVTYREAIQGLTAQPDREVLLAEDAADFARQVVRLLNDPPAARALGAAARRHVERDYSWDSRARAYEHLYGDLIARRRDATGVPASLRTSTRTTSITAC
jgi:glycosyltransferase involved in cell wall biosynthesis